ncbi:IS66 family transposase, partial [Bradyrhizobium sp. CCBAU 45394]|uniref:IS66 family transposase n=1 Tax=Bradyrhizobium sp. CCBAU 45394 TaxID=1325087 RepID=UPI002303B2D4
RSSIPCQFKPCRQIKSKLLHICRRCSGPVVQAHAPEHVVPSGLPTEAAIAHVIVSKFGDHTPFYRQSEIYARQGIRLDRATLGNWSGRACFHLQITALGLTSSVEHNGYGRPAPVPCRRSHGRAAA